MPRPRNVWLITRFTLQEAVSRRLILAGVLISLGYLALFTLGFHFAYDRALDNATTVEARLTLGLAFGTLTLFGIYVVNYLASFLALFLSVGAISGEIDSGTLHAVLARPLARAEFVLGRWLGYVMLIGAYIVAMTSLVLLIARLVAGYSVPDLVHALAIMLLEGVLLVTLSLFGSSWLPTLANGVVVFTLLGLAWLAGIIEFIGRIMAGAPNTSGSDALLNTGTIVSLVLPSDALWRGASYYLQPPALLASLGIVRGGGGIPFFSTEPPTPALIIWSLGYIAVVLVGAILVFSRRDL